MGKKERENLKKKKKRINVYYVRCRSITLLLLLIVFIFIFICCYEDILRGHALSVGGRWFHKRWRSFYTSERAVGFFKSGSMQ